MAPSEATAPGIWSECLQHVKFWRNEVKRSLGEPINHINIVESPEGDLKIYGLANISEDNGTSQQTIVYVSIPKGEEGNLSFSNAVPILVLKSLFNKISSVGNNSFSAEKPSPELCLFYERLRGQIVSGISNYSLHPKSNAFLLSSASTLHAYQDQKLTPIATYTNGATINATFSPVDSNYVAFCCKGQLYVDKQGESAFASEPMTNITNGVASFVAQEEFERFEGFWWSPVRVEVLYERVDESEVDELCFSVPGGRFYEEAKMRYPLAGKKNSTSTLRICHINVQHNLTLDLAMQVDLKKVVPWYEYLVRCGWTQDGENVWLYVMDRSQMQSALLLLPRIVFCHEFVENAEDFVKILYEKKSSSWINFNNLIHFLPNEPDGHLRAIIGSEKRNLCHLYLHIFNISYEEPAKLEEIGENEVIEEYSTPGVVQRDPSARFAAGGAEPEFETADSTLPSLPLVAPVPPPMQIIGSEEVVELVANAPPLPPSVVLPTPAPSDRERRPSITVRRLSQQVGVLTDHRELPITDVDDAKEWVVVKEANLTVDYRRQHVYYICTKISPTILSIGVSSYGMPSRECRVLTPEDLCYKFERCHTAVNINPDVGFVCWLSNSQTLPECRFYKLIHDQQQQYPLGMDQLPDVSAQFSSPAELPNAVYAYRIGVETMGNPLTSVMRPPPFSNNLSLGGLQSTDTTGGQSPMDTSSNVAEKRTKPTLASTFKKSSAYRAKRILAPGSPNSLLQRQLSATCNGEGSAQTMGLSSLHRSPSSIFHWKVFEYQSKNSGKIHYALLLWPTDEVMASLNANKSTNADATESRGRFPVIHAVYTGPSVQMVRNAWHSVANYMKFLTVGYAVLFVDGRGSANRGIEFESSLKYSLGTIELEDQVEGLEEVARAADDDLLDLSRVAVMGWSYGGYMSLLLLANYPHIYKCACAGGAVADWTLYDTAYTERYMGLPQEHDAEYRASAVQSHLSKLPDEDGRLLVVHGMLDENVHFRHTERLINGLIASGKPHRLLLLPNERHSVRNGEAIEYFHATLLTFFMKALA